MFLVNTDASVPVRGTHPRKVGPIRANRVGPLREILRSNSEESAHLKIEFGLRLE